jgi:hypothetical protein
MRTLERIYNSIGVDLDVTTTAKYTVMVEFDDNTVALRYAGDNLSDAIAVIRRDDPEFQRVVFITNG